MIKKILVANRGEIALRVIRACRDLGIETVAVYSEADARSRHVTAADQSVCIGPPPSPKSYLDKQAVIAAALGTGADAIHPGYGFLSENADFARICRDNGIVFVGPSPETIEFAGDKVNARTAVQKAGVPVVPGSDGAVTDLNQARRIVEEIGLPVLVKAKGGGGGRGMRIIQEGDSLDDALKDASREAAAAFGDDGLYIEKYMAAIRHVEVQIVADTHGNVVAIGDRDCTIQRRHQKLIEEAPCPVLGEATRGKLFEAAVNAAMAIDYYSVGTVEFLYEASTDTFYFIEVNSRIQVEHPVTEVLTNVDLVRTQIEIANGARIDPATLVNDVPGHAIECRINAEDPARDFFPSPGTITRYMAPGGPGIRVDGHCYQGYDFPTQYDSLLAKIIAHGPTREIAVNRMRRALAEFVIEGIDTTVPFHLEVCRDEVFRSGVYTTRFLEDRATSQAAADS